MSIDTKPGKGRKLCGGCNTYVAAVTKVCACGYDFKANKKPAEAKQPPTYDKTGKGRKLCGGCNTYVAAAAKVCACGHDFADDKKPVAVKATTAIPLAAQVAATVVGKPVVTPPPVQRQSYDPATLKVYVPGGDCPVKLKGTTIEEVAAWGDAVKDVYRERQMFLSTNGLIYFARKSWGDNQGFDIKSAEFAQVKEHLTQLYGGPS